MKHKILTLIVAVVVGVSLLAIGCATEAPSEPAQPSTPEQPSPPAAPEVEVIKWVYLGEHPSGTEYDLWVKDLASRTKAASGGRLEIRVTCGGEIVPAYDIVEAVRDGVGDMCWGNAVMQQKLIGPVGYLLTPTGLPGGPHPLELTAWYYIGDGEEIVNEIFKDYGTVIGGVASPAELFCHSNVKLESADDFKGVKFRTMGLWAELLEEYGASVITLSGSEIYEAAQRGVIDAFEYCPPAQNWPLGFHEITKYFGVPGIHSPSWLSYMIVNHNSWNELPSDLQLLLRDEIKASTVDDVLGSWYRDGLTMQKYEDYGSELVVLSDEFQESIARRSKELCDEYAAEDPLFKEVYENQIVFFKTFRGVSQVNQPRFCLFDYCE